MFELTKAEYLQNLKDKLDSLPDNPGVYLHKNKNGDIIYVGKAISLKNRVRSYFQSPKSHDAKTHMLVSNIADFEYILTTTETEALTLESNLIKKHRPRYNILLKDDKHFPYVRIDMNDPFPRVELKYSMEKGDGIKYYGPYLSRYAIFQSLEAVRDIFPLRTCSKDIKRAIKKAERPCLNYHIGKCIAPCRGNIKEEEYAAVLNSVISFLSGKSSDMRAALLEQMLKASDEMNFERAAQLRDRINAIELIGERQNVIATTGDERDVFAFERDETIGVVYMLMMRNGKIIGNDALEMLEDGDDPKEIISSFFKQYYSQKNYVPKEIVSAIEPCDKQELENWLSEIRGNKVSIVTPQRGDKKKQADIALKNAIEYLDQKAQSKRRQWERTEGALEDLTKALGLSEKPRRIEAFDISHTQGTDPVASMVVFENGRPANKQYRRFKIKSAHNDDYASMKEVLSRRFERGINEIKEGKEDGFSCFPGLLLIDGGKGQLSCALEVLDSYGISMDAVGLAEKNEELFIANNPFSIILPKGSGALHLVQRIRDEAHRFAITYHRSLRKKTMLFSVLDEIPGIGDKRKKVLFDAFITIDAIKSATIEQLNAVKGIDKKSAQAIFEHFNKQQD